jgi:glycosyltransferase involved in cell wall biosynthesis
MPRFSIITPVHLWSQGRVNDFLRCIQSVRNQTFKDFEWIVVNDGSTMPFLWHSIEDIAKVFTQPHLERVVAYNKAFSEMSGEWVVFLDSDDEIDPQSLEKLDKIIKDNPKYSLFNFGCKFIHKDGKETFRDPFEPKREKVGHEVFGGGNIVNGTFIFKKKVWEEMGGFPDQDIENVDCSEINYGGVRNLSMCSPWDFSAYYQLKYPEVRKYFMVDHEMEKDKIVKELGNPWGQDWALWYTYTRKYHSLPIKEYLYWVHPR